MPSLRWSEVPYLFTSHVGGAAETLWRCSVTPRSEGGWRRPEKIPGLRRTPSYRWGRLLWACQQSSKDAESIG